MKVTKTRVFSRGAEAKNNAAAAQKQAAAAGRARYMLHLYIKKSTRITGGHCHCARRTHKQKKAPGLLSGGLCLSFCKDKLSFTRSAITK